MKTKKHIHFIGIKGVGMTPLAIIAKEAGFSVTGSDVAETFITDEALEKAGITPFAGFSEEHVQNADLVILTGAHGGINNVEATAAKAQGKPILLQGQAVGEFMRGKLFEREFDGVSVAGTHGKTTTTAMIATLLKHAKKDSSYVIGTSNIPTLGLPGHFGTGNYFIAEADEYATEPTYDKTTKFLWQHPKIALFTNIELDHTDIYSSIDELRDVFLQFANQLPPSGLLIACGDNPQIQQLLEAYKGRVITYGFNSTNDFRIQRVSVSGQQIFFWVELKGVSLGEFVIQVPGEHNVLNATATLVFGLEAHLDIDVIKEGIKLYTGSKRRAEYRGQLLSGAKVYDDYAHHPTEIKKTLQAFKKKYPDEKIVCIFQPHTFSRTKILFADFLTSFDEADSVILSDIYPSMRETVDQSISSEMLVESLKKKKKDVFYAGDLSGVVKYVAEQQYDERTVIIIMGAGDIYKILDQLELKKEL